MVLQKLISHRGNTTGPIVSKENEPSYILETINKGFDCEVDVWIVDKKLILGHDKPEYKISINFLNDINSYLWIHCKNFEALQYFNCHNQFNYFWHEKDKFTLTSRGFIWTYPENQVSSKSIIVDNNNKFSDYSCYGVCSDYIEMYK